MVSTTVDLCANIQLHNTNNHKEGGEEKEEGAEETWVECEFLVVMCAVCQIQACHRSSISHHGHFQFDSLTKSSPLFAGIYQHVEQTISVELNEMKFVKNDAVFIEQLSSYKVIARLEDDRQQPSWMDG